MGKDSLKLSISKIMVLLVTMVTSMLLSRFRTLSEYGTYSQILLVVNLFISMFSLGIPNSINYFMIKFDSNTSKKFFLSNYFSMNFVMGLLMGCLAIAILPLIANFFNNPYIIKFWFLLALLPFCKLIVSSIGNFLIVYKKITSLMVYNVISALFLLSIVFICEILGWGFWEYTIMLLCVEIFLAVLVFIIVFRLAGKLDFVLDKGMLKKIFAYTIPSGLAASVSVLNSELDKLMIGYLIDVESAALYANAARELPVTIISASFTAILLPKMVLDAKNKDYNSAVNKWSLCIKFNFILLCFCSMICVVFAPQIITLLYSAKYVDGANVFRVYSIALLLRVTYFGMILNATGKTKFVFWSTIVALVTNIILDYVLFFIFGFIGPAIATIVSIFVIQFAQLKFSSSLINVKFKNIFPWIFLFKVCSINCVIGAILWSTIQYFELGIDAVQIIKSVLLGVIACVFYFLIYKNTMFSLWKKMNKER